MLKYAILLISANLIVSKIASAADPYCAKELCPGGAPHIACGNDGTFSTDCPIGTSVVNEYSVIDSLHDLHNIQRDLLAGGYVPGYQSAYRMRMMAWNNELAEMATLQAKTCRAKNTHCRNTPTFPRSGQNVGIISYTGPKDSKTDGYLMNRIFMSWWNQHKNGTMAMMNNYPQNRPVPRFALLANENNIAVGCGAVRYRKNSRNYFHLVCNYAIVNTVGKPVYTPGPPAQGCTRADFFLLNLCGPIDSK